MNQKCEFRRLYALANDKFRKDQVNIVAYQNEIRQAEKVCRKCERLKDCIK
jgi:hypothetical protein